MNDLLTSRFSARLPDSLEFKTNQTLVYSSDIGDRSIRYTFQQPTGWVNKIYISFARFSGLTLTTGRTYPTKEECDQDAIMLAKQAEAYIEEKIGKLRSPDCLKPVITKSGLIDIPKTKHRMILWQLLNASHLGNLDGIGLRIVSTRTLAKPQVSLLFLHVQVWITAIRLELIPDISDLNCFLYGCAYKPEGFQFNEIADRLPF